MNTYEWKKILRLDGRKSCNKEILENFLKNHKITISREEVANEKRKFTVNQAATTYRNKKKKEEQREVAEIAYLEAIKCQMMMEQRILMEEIRFYNQAQMYQEEEYYYYW